LINNAGAMFGARAVTLDGFEATWQVNCLGPHLLARLMMPALARAAAAASPPHAPGAARYVYVGSRLEQRGKVADELSLALCQPKTQDAPGLQAAVDTRAGGTAHPMFSSLPRALASVEGGTGDDKFDTFGVYGTAKQAGTALTYELARRVEAEVTGAAARGGNNCGSSGITIHACTPGLVHTNLGRFANPVLRVLATPVQWALTKTSKQGAEVPLWLARSESDEIIGAGSSGGYFGTEGSFAPGPVVALVSSKTSRDPKVGSKLWDLCQEMHGDVDGPLVT